MHILQALARAGHARPHGHTLEQFAALLRRAGALPDELGAALRCYQEVRFGGRKFDAARERCMHAGLCAALALPAPGGQAGDTAGQR